MKIILFGGAGYIGSHLVPALLEDGHDVTVAVSRLVLPVSNHERLAYVSADVTNQKAVLDVVAGADVVYNFAAIASIQDCVDRPADAIRVNILGAQYLLDACVKQHVGRYIQASSVYAFSKNGGVYSITKRCSEDLVLFYHHTYGLPFSILRYGTIYGPQAGQGNSIYNYVRQALEHRKIDYPGSGDELREYIHIQDAVRITRHILDVSYENHVLLISGLYPYAVRDVLEIIREMLNDSVSLEYRKEGVPHHYKRTPYNFLETVAQKVIHGNYIDMHQGLMDSIMQISQQIRANESLYAEPLRRDYSHKIE